RPPPPPPPLGGPQPIYSERQHWSPDTRRLLIVLAVGPGGSYSCQVVGPPVRSLAPESEEFHVWLPSAISAGRAPASASRCHTPIAGPAVDGIPTSRACAFPTAPAATSTASTSARPASRPARSFAASQGPGTPMEILTVIGIIAAFSLVCAAIYRVGRSLQPQGREI